MAVIELEVDEETARRWQAADAEARARYTTLLSGWMATPTERLLAGARLRETMSRVSRNARKRGLTPEILDDILSDA